MINSTPLFCSLCTEGLCDENKIPQNKSDPKYLWRWTSKYCTYDPKTVDQFLLYFPYVLLIIAIILCLIERVFNSYFKSSKQLKLFHELLVKESILDDKTKGEDCEDQGILTYNVYFDEYSSTFTNTYIGSFAI